MFSLLVSQWRNSLPNPDFPLVEVLAKLPVVLFISQDSFPFSEYSYYQIVPDALVYIKTLGSTSLSGRWMKIERNRLLF